MNKPDYKADDADYDARLKEAMQNAGAMLWASALLDPDNKAPRVQMLRQKTLRRRAAKLCYEAGERWGKLADRLYDEMNEPNDKKEEDNE